MFVSSSNVESRYLPFVTLALIVLTICVFIKSYTLECKAHHEYQKNAMGIWMGEVNEDNLNSNTELVEFQDDWGFTFSDLTARGDFCSMFTYMFVHSDLRPIVISICLLWVFGLAVEEAFTSPVFGVFYIVCGVVSAFAYGIMNTGNEWPLLGAEGAVSGVMGAFFVLFGAQAKINIVGRFGKFSVPAALFGFLYIGSKVLDLGFLNSEGLLAASIVSTLAGMGAGAAFAFLLKGDLNGSIEKKRDGSVIIRRETKQVNEEELLEQVLQCQPVNIVVDHVLEDDQDVECPKCGSPLDMQHPFGDRLVRCKGGSCTQVTYVDVDLLMSAGAVVKL